MAGSYKFLSPYLYGLAASERAESKRCARIITEQAEGPISGNRGKRRWSGGGVLSTGGLRPCQLPDASRKTL